MKLMALAASRAALGGPLARIAVAATAIGGVALAVGLASGFAATALATLAAIWLFCAGMAAGGVAVSAAVRTVHGRWAATVLPIADASAGFFTPALLPLAIIVLAARAWMPPAAVPAASSVAWLAARDLGATVLLFAVGRRYVAGARRAGAEPSSRAAVAYLLLYAATLSLWAVDLIMGLRRGAPSTVIPAYYFMGAFLSGLAWVALVGAVRGAPVSLGARLDLTKLLFAFASFWMYLLWSSYLPVWYGDLPDETGEFLARWTGPWAILSVGVLLAVFVVPFGLFFPEAPRRGRLGLAVGSSLLLSGLLCERLLLVLPSLPLGGGLPALLVSAAITIGLLALFVLSVGAALGAGDRGREAVSPSA